jgi:hypothetical protein
VCLIVIDRSIAVAAIARMAQFHEELKSLFCHHNLNLLSDLGRRNTLLSSAQEKFFSDGLRENGFSVKSDGRPGQPDITVCDVTGAGEIEIECKLTTRNSQGGIILQTDYMTLQRKGSLDYLYVISDAEFEKFAVLYFKGLTVENFRVPAAGSRGKAGMLKHTCYDKCSVLYGGYHRLNDRRISKIQADLARDITKKKRERLEKKLEYWSSVPDKFEIELDSI